eukprot:709930-Pyramimonas_sp.AAC.1
MVGHADARPSPRPIRLRTASLYPPNLESARRSRSRVPEPMANLAPGAPRHGARRRRSNAPSAASNASTWLCYQISPRACASGARLRYLHLDRATLHGVRSLAHSNEL